MRKDLIYNNEKVFEKAKKVCENRFLGSNDIDRNGTSMLWNSTNNSIR